MHTKQQPANDEHSNNRRKPGRNGASATLRVPPNNDNGKHYKHAIGGRIIDRDSGPGRRKDSCHRDMVSFTQVQGQCRQGHSSIAIHSRIPHKREFVIRPSSDEGRLAEVAAAHVPSASHSARRWVSRVVGRRPACLDFNGFVPFGSAGRATCSWAPGSAGASVRALPASAAAAARACSGQAR
jgi:hypothetical protein